MLQLEFGSLGSLYETYHVEDKGLSLDAWREGTVWHLRWGAHGITAEFGRG